MNEFGSYLRLRRKARRLHMTEVEQLTGVCVSSQSNYERGKCKPSPDNLERLAKVYETSLEYLLSLIELDKQAKYNKQKTI